MDALAENKALVREFFAAIDAGNIGAMDDLVAEDYDDRRPGPFPGLPPGREGLKRTFEIFLRSSPGSHEILDQFAEGDLVVTRIRARARFATVGPDVTATAVHRIKDGKLVEHLGELESIKLIQQFGLGPARAG